MAGASGWPRHQGIVVGSAGRLALAGSSGSGAPVMTRHTDWSSGLASGCTEHQKTGPPVRRGVFWPPWAPPGPKAYQRPFLSH